MRFLAFQAWRVVDVKDARANSSKTPISRPNHSDHSGGRPTNISSDGHGKFLSGIQGLLDRLCLCGLLARVARVETINLLVADNCDRYFL
jgi:hypothetical protein